MGESTARRLKLAPKIGRADTLLVVLGDQLGRRAPILRTLDRSRDAVVMFEVTREAEHVPSHVQRTVLFLSAMRHFAADLMKSGFRVHYVALDEQLNTHAIDTELERALSKIQPVRVAVTRPGEHRVDKMIREVCQRHNTHLDVHPDASFTCSLDDFDRWADGRSNLVMEHFYRWRRRALDIMVKNDKPAGGQWNFDEENRHSFKSAPSVPAPYRPRMDTVTRDVIELVKRRFPNAPGRIDHFRWPVTPDQARRGLRDFVAKRLEHFGTYEDAMWTGEPVLFHSMLSPSLNLKLIPPIECVRAAADAYGEGRVALNNVEGFVRQIIGWREFVRGVYYREGPDYPNRNGLGQKGKLPVFYWTGDTDMTCLRYCIGDVLDNAYSHHIPRLMVVGNFALIAGVRPRAVHEWFLGMYADAVEWVTAPNVVGMSQHADHGIVATKPYAASGSYINRMSNYCEKCRYDVGTRTGDGACPFNTFYWDFLLRHRKRFAKNRRMLLVMGHVKRLSPGDRRAIQRHAATLRDKFGI